MPTLEFMVWYPDHHFGVGELSAVNGIAGAYMEKGSIISIIWYPSQATQEARTNLLPHIRRR